MKYFIILLTLGINSCQGEEFSCDIGSLHGWFDVTFTRVDGDCGDLSSSLWRFGGLPTDCAQHSRAVTACTLVEQTACPYADGTIVTQAAYTQVDVDHVLGAATITITLGRIPCTGHYLLDAIKYCD